MKKIILIISILLSSIFIASANTNKDDKKLCSGFGKWSKEGEFKIRDFHQLQNSRELQQPSPIPTWLHKFKVTTSISKLVPRRFYEEKNIIYHRKMKAKSFVDTQISIMLFYPLSTYHPIQFRPKTWIHWDFILLTHKGPFYIVTAIVNARKVNFIAPDHCLIGVTKQYNEQQKKLYQDKHLKQVPYPTFLIKCSSSFPVYPLELLLPQSDFQGKIF